MLCYIHIMYSKRMTGIVKADTSCRCQLMSSTLSCTHYVMMPSLLCKVMSAFQDNPLLFIKKNGFSINISVLGLS